MQANTQVPFMRQPQRHPGEVPFYIFCVTLNLSLAAFALFLSEQIKGLLGQSLGSVLVSLVGDSIWAVLGVIPLIVVARELMRARVRANAILLSREQYPDIYALMENFAVRMGLMQRFSLRKWKRLELYLQNGNGTLNAFAAQASGKGYVTLFSELFSDLYANDRDGLAFILGHELAHIRLWHTNLLYLLSVCYVAGLPMIGTTLSRLREMSCDNFGATLSPRGVNGLLLLTAGRHNYRYVNLPAFLQRAPEQRSWFVWLVQFATASHPFMVYRIPRLFKLGLFEPPSGGSPLAGVPPTPQPVAP